MKLAVTFRIVVTSTIKSLYLERTSARGMLIHAKHCRWPVPSKLMAHRKVGLSCGRADTRKMVEVTPSRKPVSYERVGELSSFPSPFQRQKVRGRTKHAGLGKAHRTPKNRNVNQHCGDPLRTVSETKTQKGAVISLGTSPSLYLGRNA